MWFRILHVAVDAGNGAWPAGYREQRVEVTLGSKMAFESRNVGAVMRRVTADSQGAIRSRDAPPPHLSPSTR